ncbi:MAG: FtsH protease activity modulator HflK [Cellvibrionaceae bacterium]
MAWNEPGGDQKDPWGGGKRGGSGGDQGPPDLDEMLKKFQQKMNAIFGGAGGGNSGKGFSAAAFGVLGLVLLAVYFVSGVRIINEQERGVVLRLGVYDRTLAPGFNWIPPLIDRMHKVNVTGLRFHNVKRISMLTQDLNIVEVDLSVQYVIGNAQDFVLNVRNPEDSLREATDSALRHEVGATVMHEVLTEGRGQLAIQVGDRLQEYLDNYGTGITIRAVNVEETTPPQEVQSAFDDVNRAREDEERVKNEAQAYSNGIIPESRGKAKRMIEEANGYREQVIARAEGEADRFQKLLAEYKKAPDVTRERLYLDAVESVMANSTKIMIDVEGGNNMMYLPLDKMVSQTSSSSREEGMSESDILDVEQRVLERLRNELTTSSRRR